MIDWWLLAPNLVAALDVDNVASLWLHIDPAFLERRERANAEFLAGSDDPERMLANFLHRSLWRNRFIASEAHRLGLPLLHQDGTIPVDTLVDTALKLLGWNHPRPSR